MAMFDDLDFLVGHIRNSYITSDDTGMCELILDGEEMEKTGKRPQSGNHFARWPAGGSMHDSGLESEGDLSHSPDILPDMDYDAHRRRSNTAQRLERMKKEKRNHCKIKRIQWKDSPEVYIPEKHGHLFDKKEMTPKSQRKGVSLLSQQLEAAACLPNNPFREYARYDGKVHMGVPTKKIDIFLTMALAADRPYPMTVVTQITAKVQDLIGLICWQYTNEGREPRLADKLEAFSLHITEDDGEVDMDFPALDNREPISKFGFGKLALVERELPPSSPKAAIVVTINMPNRGFSQFDVDDESVLMKELVDKVLAKRKLKHKGLEYILEKQKQPGKALDLELPLSSMDTHDFCLLRMNSNRGDLSHEEKVFDTSGVAESLTSHQYKSYRVNMAHKLRPITEVQLGVSGEKLEIDPVSAKGAAKFFKQKAVTIDGEHIASCDMLEEKNGKGSFRLTYIKEPHDYKHHDFDTDITTAREIVLKISNILEMRSSPVRKDYLATKDKKRRFPHMHH